MVKTSYVGVPVGSEDSFDRSVQSSDRFRFSRIIKKHRFVSRKKRKALAGRSPLFSISDIWSGFSSDVKNSWGLAGAVVGLSGYDLFVLDQSARVKCGLSGSAVPSVFHQCRVGHLSVVSPANEIKIEQKHPHFCWSVRKVVGKKSMFEPVLINEDFSLPLKISLNYSSDLSSVGEGAFAEFYAYIWHSFQGEDIFTKLAIPLDFSAGWCYAESELTSLSGYVVAYSLFFHLKNLVGDLYFDDLSCVHSEQNWVRDQFCENVSEIFSGGFSRVLKNWEGVVVPSGASFESIYKDF
jgi:hypothetical protein